MDKQQYKRLSVDFPAEEYIYLKLACTKKGVSVKDFVTQSVIRSVEEYEDELILSKLAEITDEDRQNAIPWEEMEKRLGWDKL